MLELTLLCRQRIELVVVELAELLNVDGSTLFVGFVVELGVVLVDLGSLVVVVAVAEESAQASQEASQ